MDKADKEKITEIIEDLEWLEKLLNQRIRELHQKINSEGPWLWQQSRHAYIMYRGAVSRAIRNLEKLLLKRK